MSAPSSTAICCPDAKTGRRADAFSGLKVWLKDLRLLLREAFGILRRNPARVALVTLAAALAAMLILAPAEPGWLRWVAEFRRSESGGWLSTPAWALSEYGDFLGFNVALFAVLGLSRRLRLVLLASLAGTLLCGGAANVLRPLLGRARPNAQVQPGFYGPSLSARYHSCPSGHTATAFGAGVPVLVAIPPLGVPVIIVAGAVAWSRFHNRAHHPSDIFFSILIAGIAGVPLGMAARRLAGRRGVIQALPAAR
jgi:membrane-associated phospholipid phosphatase